MNLTTSLLTLASQNLTSSLQNVGGYKYCHEFYGTFSRTRDCSQVIGLLERGADEVSYDVHSGIGAHALPLSKTFGTCMVQVDVAGPRLPRTFDISPNDIREMATEVLDGCVNGPFNIGGFATSNLQVMENWITAEETKFDRPFPTSTAFITVTLSNIVPDWLSPGNYDPIIAYQFAQTEIAAIDRAYTLRERIDLRRRAERLRHQGMRMEPRGNRVPWWENPAPRVQVNETSVDTGEGTVSIELTKPVAGEAGTATSRRRRRRT